MTLSPFAGPAVQNLDAAQFSFTSDSYGYMLTYRGQPIGGAGVLTRSPMRGSTRQKNLKMHRESAQRALQSMMGGSGIPSMRAAAAQIEAQHSAWR